MLEGLGAARVSLIGTSMGGIISMTYAGGWPERVERLVVNDVGPEVDQAGLTRIANYVGTAPERFENIGEVAKYYKENYPAMAKLADEVVAEQVNGPSSRGPKAGSCGRWTPTCGGRCVAAPRNNDSICGCRTRESRARS